MYMPLVASEDGIVQLIKQPGVSLEPGDILGILTLDDPARVKHAKPFEGLLPTMGTPAPTGNGSAAPAASSSSAAAKPVKKAEEINTTTVEIDATFAASADDLFSLMTDERRIPTWTRAPAKVRRRGDSFRIN